MMGVYGKAIAGVLTTAAILLLTFLTGDETFADITQREWLHVGIELLAIGGIVYAVPNAPKKVVTDVD